MILLGKPIAYGSARLGHIPSLPKESQLPLKPCFMLQSSDFEGNCDFSDFLLDFCFYFRYSFDLLRKCGLLAHTSAAFLKNCWIKKLFSSLMAYNWKARFLEKPSAYGSAEMLRCLPLCCSPVVTLSEFVMNFSWILVFLNFLCF